VPLQSVEINFIVGAMHRSDGGKSVMYGVGPKICAIAQILPGDFIKLLRQNRDVLGVLGSTSRIDDTQHSGIGFDISGNSLQDSRVGRRGPPAGIRRRLLNCRHNSGNCKVYL
jgi:hypothetical protein